MYIVTVPTVVERTYKIMADSEAEALEEYRMFSTTWSTDGKAEYIEETTGDDGGDELMYEAQVTECLGNIDFDGEPYVEEEDDEDDEDDED